jgi:hypothetical protein
MIKELIAVDVYSIPRADLNPTGDPSRRKTRKYSRQSLARFRAASR